MLKEDDTIVHASLIKMVHGMNAVFIPIRCRKHFSFRYVTHLAMGLLCEKISRCLHPTEAPRRSFFVCY